MQTSELAQGDRVESLSDFASRAGISLSTLRRMIDRGQGPVVTRLSERKVGIRLSHGTRWLDARAEQQPTAA